ncbi:MAG: FAD-dependent oxidoreductase, partial [Candidatus Entotheonellia bacterium]
RQSTADSTRLISMGTREAVTNLHIAESSKLFIKVKPWWRTDSTRIRCISADTTLANFYTLDYGDPDEAICLVNYTWEDFSEKSEALGPLNVRYQRLLDDLKNLAPDYVLQGMPPEATADNGVMIDWQKEPHYYGAFQLTRPVQEKLLSTLFYDFQAKATPDGLAKIYFVGDSYHWTGGWSEGAFQTALNAFCAIAHSVGVPPLSGSPLDILSPHLFRYADHVDNAMITSFGPHGGTGGETPFDAPVGTGVSVQVYIIDDKSSIGRISALQVGGKTYGKPIGNPIPVGDLLAATSIKIYVFTNNSHQTFTTGRIRCIEINGKPYGASLQGGEFAYAWTSAGGDAFTITSIMGCYGDNVDRMGCVLQKNRA